MADEVAVILAHPDPNSYCAALASAAAENGTLHNLYAERFDPVMDIAELSGKGSLDPAVQRYQNTIRTARRLIVVFPDWWGGMPAILKGWLDRVWRPGVAYDVSETEPGSFVTSGLLGHLSVHLIVVSDSAAKPGMAPDKEVTTRTDTPLSRFRKKTAGEPNATRPENPVIGQWKDHICAFAGARFEGILWCGPIRISTFKQRQDWISQARKTGDGTDFSTPR